MILLLLALAASRSAVGVLLAVGSKRRGEEEKDTRQKAKMQVRLIDRSK